MGNVHWKRYFIPSAPWPIGLSGYTVMLRALAGAVVVAA